jgi:hypothetical protein
MHDLAHMVINVYTSTLNKLVSYGNPAISATSSMQLEDDFMLLCRWT